jgi:hypothetical protein
MNGDWRYTLSDNTTNHPTNPGSGTPEGISDDFNVRVTDSDGDITDGTEVLSIDINDDGPTAVNDSTSPADENASVTYDVVANDTQGADRDAKLTGATLKTGSGTVTPNLATGEITFDPANQFAGLVEIEYTIKDADGDTSKAILSMTYPPDSEPSITADSGVVSESGLPDGSAPLVADTQDSGSLTITHSGADTTALQITVSYG